METPIETQEFACQALLTENFDKPKSSVYEKIENSRRLELIRLVYL